MARDSKEWEEIYEYDPEDLMQAEVVEEMEPGWEEAFGPEGEEVRCDWCDSLFGYNGRKYKCMGCGQTLTKKAWKNFVGED